MTAPEFEETAPIVSWPELVMEIAPSAFAPTSVVMALAPVRLMAAPVAVAVAFKAPTVMTPAVWLMPPLVAVRNI